MSAPAALLAEADGTSGLQTFGFLACAAGVYAGWMFLRSRLGGWRRWVVRFETHVRPVDGDTYLWRTGYLGGAFGPILQRGLHITAAPEGLFVRPTLTNRLFHPPLLLPWRCVEVWKKGRWGWYWLVVVCRSDAPTLRINMPPYAQATLAAYRAAACRPHD